MTDLASDLAHMEVFHELSAEDRHFVASLCRERQLVAGDRLIEQGRLNSSLFFLRSGKVAVRLRRGSHAETLARLTAPAVVGEVSFLTGRPSSADVDVVVDATVAELPHAALDTDPICRDRVLRALAFVLAARLSDSNTGAARTADTPIVLLEQGAQWAAPAAFAAELSTELAIATGGDCLWLAEGTGDSSRSLTRAGDRVWTTTFGAVAGSGPLRAALAESLPAWTSRFGAIVVSGPTRDANESARPFATHRVQLIGPGDPVPSADRPTDYVIQDARHPTLPHLSVRTRLLWDLVEAERAHADRQPLPDRFRRGVGAVVRAIEGTTLGVVLGAGGARGWANIGVLEVLTRAGLPCDAIAGSSMGAIVGGVVACGTPIGDLRRVMAEWPERRRQLREFRLWQMHLASDIGIRDLLAHFFGDRAVSTLEIPYAANAVDIERGEEVMIRSGLLRDAARASMAFPGWLPPFVLRDRVLVDGATLNPVPWSACHALGADVTVAVNVLGLTAFRALPTRWPRRQFEVMARTFEMSGYSMGHVHSAADSDTMITPDLGDATMLSFERYDEMIEAGAKAAEARLPAILAAYAQANARRRAGALTRDPTPPRDERLQPPDA